MLGWLLIAVATLMVIAQIVQDRIQYPRFKAMTETGRRQKMYRYWVIDGIIRYGMLGVLGLYLLGQLGALVTMPEAIDDSRDVVARFFGIELAHFSALGLILAAALMAGVVFGGVLPFFIKKKDTTAVPALGDIEALLPRNRREMVWGAAISINAGVSEEIFFRLMLPLAIYAVHPDVFVAFGAAAILFGLVHAYQGIVGIIATFVVGIVMTLIYLSTGQIWLAIALHVLIDLRGMILAPITYDAHKIP